MRRCGIFSPAYNSALKMWKPDSIMFYITIGPYIVHLNYQKKRRIIMKQNDFRRMLSLCLAVVLLITGIPAAGAAEAEPVTEPTAAATVPLETTDEQMQTEPLPSEPEATESAEQTEATESVEETEETEATAPTEETIVSEATEPVEENEATEATEPVEETEAADPEEGTYVTEETMPVEETEPALLPYGLRGLPEGYVLSDLAMEKKTAMLENNVLETLRNLTPVEDYVEDEIILSVESEEEAALMAEAFSGELLRYNDGIAVIRLLTATVCEAVEVSLDMTLALPAATPNYLTKLKETDSTAVRQTSSQLPEEQSWHTWVQENMTDPDPFLYEAYSDDYQWIHDTVDTYAAWGVTTGESWVKVAILCDGVYTDHPELEGKVTEYDAGAGIGDPGSLATNIAGIIAATMDNGEGGAGIAPGVSIMSYNILHSEDDDGYRIYKTEYILRAIKHAAANGAHIINMGFWQYEYVWDIQYEIQKAVDRGVTVIAPMGDDGYNTMTYPAAYDGVIAVAGTTRTNSKLKYSNYGAWADLSAPGETVTTTDLYDPWLNEYYWELDGTLLSAAIVSGVAALYTSACGDRVAPATMEKVLKAAATKISGSGMGKGLVNAANMFDDKPAAPFCVITDGTFEYDPKRPVPCESKLYIYESETAAKSGRQGDMTGVFLYTINGKTPSVKNGEVVNGEVMPEPYCLDLKEFAGSKVTLKIAHVSGMGIVGKIRTLTLNVAEGKQIEGITIHGASTVIAGKSTTYTATVHPVGIADQSVTWEIESRSASMVGAKISATGKLTTPKDQSGYLYIQANSKADSWIWSEPFYVEVECIQPVSKIELKTQENENAKSGYSFAGYRFTLIPTMYAKEADTNQLVPVERDVRWTSSNKKVATVDSNGTVHALSKGTATITCTVLDGSGKSAKCKMTVRQPVEEITVSGQASIAPGASAAYKAVVAPSNAHNKKVNWSLEGAPDGVTISPTTGKVTVASNVALGSSFTVVATSKDEKADGEEKISTRYPVVVRPKCTALHVGVGRYWGSYAPGPVYSGSYVKSVNLFSECRDYEDDNWINLDPVCEGNPDAFVEWSSSNPKVASVDEDGRVTAHKAGTANITVKASDGSGKKTTVKIKVTNPVSSMEIRSSNDYSDIGFGKTVKHTVFFADTYGVPSNKKVTWDFFVYDYDPYWGEIYADYTDIFKTTKLITLDKNGNLSIKKGAEKYWEEFEGEMRIAVYAYATDGTGEYAYTHYYVRPLIKKLSIDPDYKTVTTKSNAYGYAYFYRNLNARELEDADYVPFVGTSSNPKVVGVIDITPVVDEAPNLYRIKFRTGKLDTSGSAKITIKATDGSNKSCSFTVKVTP